MELTPPNIAKITRPTALHLLNRPRLFAALDRARHRAATWVTAPPGFGKTSLASSYVAHWPWLVKVYALGRFVIAKDGPSIETH